MDSARCNIAVSPDTDQSVCMLLAAQGGSRDGDLSRVVEEAVPRYIFERAVDQAKAANVNVNLSEAKSEMEASIALALDELEMLTAEVQTRQRLNALRQPVFFFAQCQAVIGVEV